MRKAQVIGGGAALLLLLPALGTGALAQGRRASTCADQVCAIDFNALELEPATLQPFDAAVNKALIAAPPTHCDSGRCVLNMSRTEWHARAATALQSAGYCTGDTGTDELTVGVKNEVGELVVNYHIFAGDPAGPGT